jgi:hypothetical protein
MCVQGSDNWFCDRLPVAYYNVVRRIGDSANES